MKKKEFSLEKKNEILNAYNNHELKVVDIQKTFGISNRNLMEIVLEMGGELRRPKSSTRLKHPFCKACRSYAIVNAKYCPFCGADLRTEKDILIEKTVWLRNETVMLVPSQKRDKARDIFNEIIAYIKNDTTK